MRRGSERQPLRSSSSFPVFFVFGLLEIVLIRFAALG
jgi:hypothetical protein